MFTTLSEPSLRASYYWTELNIFIQLSVQRFDLLWLSEPPKGELVQQQQLELNQIYSFNFLLKDLHLYILVTSKFLLENPYQAQVKLI